MEQMKLIKNIDILHALELPINEAAEKISSFLRHVYDAGYNAGCKKGYIEGRNYGWDEYANQSHEMRR